MEEPFKSFMRKTVPRVFDPMQIYDRAFLDAIDEEIKDKIQIGKFIKQDKQIYNSLKCVEIPSNTHCKTLYLSKSRYDIL